MCVLGLHRVIAIPGYPHPDCNSCPNMGDRQQQDLAGRTDGRTDGQTDVRSPLFDEELDANATHDTSESGCARAPSVPCRALLGLLI